MKSNFNCKTPNLLYIIIYSAYNKEHTEYIEGQVKERLSIYRQHIRQPKYKKVEVIGHLHACAKEIFKMKENNKILRECYKDHLIRKFKSDMNRLGTYFATVKLSTLLELIKVELKLQLYYSKKNITIPSKRNYKLQLIEKLKKWLSA